MSNIETENPTIFSDISVKKDDETYYIHKIKQSCEMTFFYDIDFNNNFNTYFKIEPLQSDIVVKNDFLIAIINYDLLTEYNIPAVFLSIINKDKWISINNY